MEVFDRIIGANIDEISIPQVFEAFLAFSTAEKAEVRPKITALLLSTLADNFDQLLPTQLIQLCKVLLAQEGSTINTKGSDIIMGLDLDRFILSQIGSLD